jgi:hypothetical protein
VTAPKDSQHNNARHKRRHIFESREESFDIVGDLLRCDTSMVIANANAASIKVSSRVIARPRNRNPLSRGSASNSRGKPDAISCARSFIWLAILPQLSVIGEADSFPASTRSILDNFVDSVTMAR